VTFLIFLELFEACLEARKETNYDEVHGGHAHYVYAPDEAHSVKNHEPLTSYRFPHKDYFRTTYRG